MSEFNWKSHRIKPLNDYKTNDADLTLADYKMWRNDATRNTKAVGAAYILKMIDKIEFKDNDIPRLVDQSKDDDYTSTTFMKHMVTLAQQCGKQFKEEDPALDAKVKKNYFRVELDLQSF
eukprot:CAMPEP_0181303728 /NCGR_PEP_ID=MMETSP1101-20121128/8725_1 /TAXON_ID=46948 /ORGANISM="Rhodomonas abbreviata, Strain Caron Lab Isolate" /LENGTH=119 /DNA_ID=CAMNT_0023409345 /DNA_START=80 /DNA_END=439 /DNA_ORIENTATION=+